MGGPGCHGETMLATLKEGLLPIFALLSHIPSVRDLCHEPKAERQRTS